MGKIRFFYDNLVDIATVSAKSSATGFPAANVQNQWYKKTHRSTACTDEWFKFDIGADPERIYYLIWYYHNISSAATITIQANSEDYWEGSGGTVIEWTPTWKTNYILYEFPNPPIYRYYRMRVQDPTNSDGYLRVGRPFLGPYFEPTYHFQSHSRIITDPSELVFSSNRQMSANAKNIFRTFEIAFEGLPATDYASFVTMFQIVGKNKPFFVMLEDDDDDSLYYVHFAGDLNFQPLTKDWWSLSITLEEDV